MYGYMDYDEMNDGFEASITNLVGTGRGIVPMPGLGIVYKQDYPLFAKGAVDRRQGSKEIAEDGNPMVLYDYFNEEGTTGAPLRLSSPYSPFISGPGVVALGYERRGYNLVLIIIEPLN